MKTLDTSLLGALLAAALSLPAAAQLPDPVPVRLIGINDLHGNLESTGLNLFLNDPTAAPGQPQMRVATGGVAALAGTVRSLRAGSPYSLMIAAGDLIGGAPLISTLFKHETTIDILGDIGLDVSSLGNHEFDAGERELQRIIAGGCAPTVPQDVIASCVQAPYKGARFKYIAANVKDARGRHIVAPYIVKDFAGIPVGIIGGVTRTTPQMVVPSGVAGLVFEDEADAVNRAAGELRAQGIRAMVAVLHEGLELGTPQKRGDWNDPTCPEAHGPLLDIAARLAPEIRVVFSGHTHQGYRCEVGGRLLLSGTAFGRAVSVVDVELDRSTRAMLPPVRSHNLPVFNDQTEAAHRDKLAAAAPAAYGAALREARPDAAIAGKVAGYARLVAPKANREVAKIAGTFSRTSNVDSAAGRLIADAQLAATRAEGAQVAFMNPGGIRANLDCAAPPCTVTFGQAFTVQPFGNSLVVMSLTGAQVKTLLEQQLQQASGNPRFLQPSAGFTYVWEHAAPVGQRVRDMVLDGQPIDPAKTYRVTVNSFLAEGGDGFTVLKDGRELKGGGQDIDALVAYLAAQERAPIPTPRVTRR